MQKVSHILRELIEDNELLQLGLHNRLLNLSQLARFLQNQIEARAQRNIELSAITMALSRLQKDFEATQVLQRRQTPIVNMTIHSQLLIRVFAMNASIRPAINKLYNQVQRKSAYITISEGISEVSIITQMQFLEYINTHFETDFIYGYEDVSSIAVKFAPDFFETAGVFHTIVQQLYFQNINILEMSSAGTEFILYLEEKDVKLAFDTIYRKMNQ